MNDEATVASQLTTESFATKFSDAIQNAVVMGVKRASEANNNNSEDTINRPTNASDRPNPDGSITSQFKRRRDGSE